MPVGLPLAIPRGFVLPARPNAGPALRRRVVDPNSRGYYTNAARPPRARLPPDHDLDILIERREQIHQPFDRETRELVVAKSGYFQLRHSEQLGGRRLRQLALQEQLIQGIHQAQFA